MPCRPVATRGIELYDNYSSFTILSLQRGANWTHLHSLHPFDSHGPFELTSVVSPQVARTETAAVNNHQRSTDDERMRNHRMQRVSVNRK